MVPALLVWLRVIRDVDTGERLSPDAATRRVFLLEAGHPTLMGLAVGYFL
jgi:hypothetical protein